jgi:hypothetical protein
VVLKREILKKLQPHQITISTLSEVFMQNHASPSERLTTRYPKNIIQPSFPSSTVGANSLQNHGIMNLQDHRLNDSAVRFF